MPRPPTGVTSSGMLRPRPFGDTGLVVPALGLGGGPLGDPSRSDDEVRALLFAALDLGVTFVDTAPSYGRSEERIGRLLGSRRRDVLVSTKVGYGIEGVPDWTGECVRRGVDRALELLGGDALDVVHLHSCPRHVLERDDVVRALSDAVGAGKVRVAAYSGDNDDLAFALSLGVFGAVQCSLSAVDQAALDENLPRAAGAGRGVIAKRPLANAAWRHSERPQADDVAEYWERWRALGLPTDDNEADDLTLRFAAFSPGVSLTLTGTKSIERLARNVSLVERGPLDADVYGGLRRAFRELGPWPGMI